MKKSTLALSVAAAIGSFGLIGNAFAIGTLEGATAGAAMVLNADGIGHQLVVPYFSAQSGNATLLNITNTDSVNAKLVKVRFRGAANSDDIFDFTLMMSPSDVWTAAVSQDPTTGLSLLKTTDASCVIPAVVKASTGALFITNRVDPTPFKGSATNETREGYVEIISMADIPPAAYKTASTAAAKAATLFGTVLHANAVAACDATVLSAALGTDTVNYIAATALGSANVTAAGLLTTAGATAQNTFNGGTAVAGDAAVAAFTATLTDAKYALAAPTGKLTADWVILNQTTTASWSGAATALQVIGTVGGVANSNAAGNLAFWPQKGIAENGNAAPLLASSSTELANHFATSDPLFTSGAVAIQPFDLPDLSTPYTGTAVTTGTAATVLPAIVRADATSVLLAVKSISNQFVTNSGISGVTDFLFAQPTRRYSVAVNYTAGGSTSSKTTDAVGAAGTRAAMVRRGATSATFGGGSAHYTEKNTTLVNRQVCLKSITSPAFFDREETKKATEFVISPGTATAFNVCGETAIASINAAGVATGSALNATVVRNDITFGTGFDLGWATFDTTNLLQGAGTTVTTDTTYAPLLTATAQTSSALPIIGSAMMRVANGSVNYGFTMASKVTR